jgi:hypothetical protein
MDIGRGCAWIRSEAGLNIFKVWIVRYFSTEHDCIQKVSEADLDNADLLGIRRDTRSSAQDEDAYMGSS